MAHGTWARKFCADSARDIGHPAFERLIDSLRAGSPQLRRWLERHEVATGSAGRKELMHPVVGRLVVEHAILRHDSSHHRLILFSPLPDVDTPAKLERLLAAEPAAA